MKNITFLSLIFISMISLFSINSIGQDLIITGVVDGSMPNGTPKAVELYVINDITDLSIYGIGSATNGEGSDGEEFTFPADAVTAGNFIYIGNTTPENFNTFFGFDPDYLTSAVNINGDDAIELFQNGSVIDLFGEIDLIGDGQYWDYTDGWAYRVNGTVCDGAFTEINWIMSGINELDDETSNGTAATPFPIGTYSHIVLPPSITITYPATTGLSFEVGTTVTITWDYENITGLANIAVDLGDGNGYFNIYTDIDITLGTYDVEIPTAAGAHPIVTTKIYMVATPSLFGESAEFALTDNTAPVIVTLIPENLETGVLVDANLEIEFDELIIPAVGNIIIKQLSDDAIFETINVTSATINMNSLTIPVTGTFEFETSYYVEIDATAITDLYGNAFLGLIGNSTWQFTTIADLYTDLDIIFPLEMNYGCDNSIDSDVPMFLENIGTETILTGETIYTFYQIEGEAIIEDTLVLEEDVYPTDTIYYIFDETADFSTLGTYNFSIWFNYESDLSTDNDSISGSVEFYELTVDLGGVNDTLEVSSYPTTLDAGTGSHDWMYVWQDASTNQTLEVNSDGWYIVQVEDTIGGCWAIDSVYVTLVENIDFVTSNTSINVYPNPNKGQFTLEVETSINNNIDIQLINVQGQIIETISQENISEYRKQFDVSEYAKGIYYIKVNTGEQIEIKKVVIQ